MSTRATIHFEDKGDTSPTAIIYRHSDGYPSGLGEDLIEFIRAVRTIRDPRLNDAAYLAAKWVVFDRDAYQKTMERIHGTQQHPLEFLSIGIVRDDPGDIEYRYHVVCDGKVSAIHYDDLNTGEKGVLLT